MTPSTDSSFPENQSSEGLIGRSANAASEALHSSIDQASSSAHGAVDRVAASAARAGSVLDEKARRVAAFPTDSLESCKQRIAAQPIEAISAALLVGFVLGWLTHRR